MEAQAHPLIPRIGQRTLLQAGLFVAAFATAGSLAVVFRPGRVEQPAPRVTVAPAPVHKMVQTRSIAVDRKPVAAKPAAPDAAQSAEAARARAALADALKAGAQTGALVPATPAPAAVFAPPAEAQGRSIAPGAAAAPELRGSLSSFAADPSPAGSAPALASIDRVAPLTHREPMKQADLQRMAASAARAIRTGDIAGARLILRRAAEGGDATALFALAETYDPRVLQKMRVRGLSGDPARAKALYEKAAAAGVTVARSRLTLQ